MYRSLQIATYSGIFRYFRHLELHFNYLNYFIHELLLELLFVFHVFSFSFQIDIYIYNLEKVIMASSVCIHNPNSSCFICGEHILKTKKKVFPMQTSVKVFHAYYKHFRIPVWDQDMPCDFHYSCQHCKKTGNLTSQCKTSMRFFSRMSLVLTDIQFKKHFFSPAWLM